MIGRLKLNSKVHTKDDKRLYKKYYCSICFALEKKYGWIYKTLVSYDVTVALMVLCIMDNLCEEKIRRCTTPPFRKQNIIFSNSYEVLLADITILLVYYKALDDLRDDNKLKGRLLCNLLRKRVEAIRINNSNLYKRVEVGMKEQEQLEKSNQKITLQDACRPFANMLSEIVSFQIEDSVDRETIRLLFFWIGSWIYLLDAYEDVYQDEKKGNYNPLIAGMMKTAEDAVKERHTELVDTLNYINRNILQILALLPQCKETAILKKLFSNNMTKKAAQTIEV